MSDGDQTSAAPADQGADVIKVEAAAFPDGSRQMVNALGLSVTIAANAPLSVQTSKRIALGVVDGDSASETDAWLATRQEIGAFMRSEDAREGPRAFAEKRAPVWLGRS